MALPDEVHTVVAAAVERHDEPGPAIEEVRRYLYNLPLDSILADLYHTLASHLVYERRHRVNSDIHAECRSSEARTTAASTVPMPGSATPKVVVGNCQAVVETFERRFKFHIAGTELGRLRGDQLLGAATKERELAGGHLFRARLAEELAKIVPPNKTVRETVSARRLDTIWKRVKAEVGAAA